MVAKRLSVDLDEVVGRETYDDRIQVLKEEGHQLFISDISRGHQEQLVWHALEDQGIDEVGVLRNYHALLSYGELVDVGVRGAVGQRQVQSMDGIVAMITRRIDPSSWKLRVDEKSHAENCCTRLVWLSRAA